MKRFLSPLVVLVTILFVTVPTINAQSNFRQGKTTTLEEGETIKDNYFAAGETVRIAGTVEGDLYSAGGNLFIDGKVSGDVLSAGGNVYITGEVNGDVRVAGGQVNIEGTVGHNVTVAAGQVNIHPQAKLGGNLVAIGGNIDLKAPVSGSLTSAGGNLLIDNEILGNVVYAGENLQLGGNSKIRGNVEYYSENEAVVMEGSTLSGSIKRNNPIRDTKDIEKRAKQVGPKMMNAWFFGSFFATLLLGLILVKLVPNYIQKVTDEQKTKTLKSLGLGFVVLVVIPILAIVLMITIVGFPLSLIILFFYLLAIYLSKIFASVFLGQFITSRATKSKSLYLDVLVGLILYYILWLIPVIGWFIQFVIMLIALGAMISQKQKLYNSLTEKKLV